MQFAAIAGALEMLIKAAPDIIKAVQMAREYISALFGGGKITKEQQDELFARVNKVAGEALLGNLPDWWQVEPDPE